MIVAYVGIWLSPSEGQWELSSQSPRDRNMQAEIDTSILFGSWDFFPPVPYWLFVETLEIFDLPPLRSTQVSCLEKERDLLENHLYFSYNVTVNLKLPQEIVFKK